MKKILLLFLLLCSLSASARNLYLVELKIWKDETFSLFNLKNERNAVELELPIDKDLFNTLKKGDILQNNSVYKGAFDIFPEFFKTFKIKVISKRVKKINDLPEKESNQMFMLKLKSQKYETFSFNFKNARNAIVFELPVDEEFYHSVKKGEKLGTIKYKIDGKTICEKDVIALEDVSEIGYWDYFKKAFENFALN